MAVKIVSAFSEVFTEKSLVDIAKENLIEYGNSVILDRALPDYRDGLKPIHRRILYSMFKEGLRYNGPYSKSAGVVGDVMKRYHPHGDMAIYGALVKMTHLPVKPISPMGNFGTLTDKKFAAQRYTEVKLAEYGEKQFFPKFNDALVPFVQNYDGKYKEPLYLPCLMPNLFLNGTEGIAVGVTSNFPPVTMESLMPFLEMAIQKKQITAKKLATGLEFNWEYGSHCVSEQTKIVEWVESGRGSLRFEPDHEIDVANKLLIVKEAPPHFNWDNVVERIAGTNKKTGKAKYPFVSSIEDMSDEKDPIRFEVKFKNTLDRTEITKHAKIVLGEFTNSFSCATNLTFRKTTGNVFFKPEAPALPSLIERWCRYRIALEAKRQTHLIKLIDADLEHHDLLLKVIENRHMFDPAWKSDNPDNYLIKNMKLTESQAALVLSWNLKAPSNLNKDKITKEKEQLFKERKVAQSIKENPSPTVISYLSSNSNKEKPNAKSTS